MPVDKALMTNAINAYRNNTVRRMPIEDGAASAVPGGDFAGMVKQALQKGIDQGKQAEQLSIAGAFERADLNAVVMAVSEAEVALQTVVTLRDKFIESYNQVLRMPI